MDNLAGNERNANTVSMWVMLTEENVFKTMSRTTAGMEEKRHMLMTMTPKATCV